MCAPAELESQIGGQNYWRNGEIAELGLHILQQEGYANDLEVDQAQTRNGMYMRTSKVGLRRLYLPASENA